MSTVLVIGGTGFVGEKLIPSLCDAGHEVVVALHRSRPDWIDGLPIKTINFDGTLECLQQAFVNAKPPALVNLAGAGVADARWSAKRKQVLSDSRLKPTDVVSRFAAAVQAPVLINASGVSLYGRSGDRADEDTASERDGFLAELACDWESAIVPGAQRIVRLRIGVVLSGKGGPMDRLMPNLLPLAYLGGGTQPFPWVHRDDVVGMISSALEDERWVGAVNAVAPESVTLKEFVRAIGKSANRFVMPMGVPSAALYLALGEMAELLLTGRHVYPKRAIEWDYPFRYAEVSAALDACVAERKER